jgi:hypothetical protein
MLTQAETHIADLTYVPDCDPAQFKEVFEGLTRWSRRCERHVTNKRVHDRKIYRTVVYVIAPLQKRVTVEKNQPARPILQVPTRNLSQSGVALVVPPRFCPRSPLDERPIISAASIFAPNATLELAVLAKQKTLLWLVGRIKRCRVMQHGFLDVGVQFLRKQN